MRPLGITPTLALYGAFACILFAATRWGMPELQAMGFRPDISWFVTGGFIFAAFALLTIVLVARETDEFSSDWLARLRIKRMTWRDWE